jgi:hypothetical protein
MTEKYASYGTSLSFSLPEGVSSLPHGARAQKEERKIMFNG